MQCHLIHILQSSLGLLSGEWIEGGGKNRRLVMMLLQLGDDGIWTVNDEDGDGERCICLGYTLRVSGKTGVIDALDIGKREKLKLSALAIEYCCLLTWGGLEKVRRHSDRSGK